MLQVPWLPANEFIPKLDDGKSLGTLTSAEGLNSGKRGGGAGWARWVQGDRGSP